MCEGKCTPDQRISEYPLGAKIKMFHLQLFEEEEGEEEEEEEEVANV